MEKSSDMGVGTGEAAASPIFSANMAFTEYIFFSFDKIQELSPDRIAGLNWCLPVSLAELCLRFCLEGL